MRDLSYDETVMVARGLDTQAAGLRRSAASRKNAGGAQAARRAQLRRLADRYTALAREFEKELL